MMFKIHSQYGPAGDQINAISELSKNLSNKLNSVLCGVTGSGKTFTMACLIEKLQKPTLIMVHNKTLAAQIYQEMKELFPGNAVEYFISYYDYFQPEAYIPSTDTYIAKEAIINEKINLMRHSATKSILERKDVIVISSVSAIYGLGSPDYYSQFSLHLQINQEINVQEISRKLVDMQYKRSEDITPGSFKINGDIIEIQPPSSLDNIIQISLAFDTIESIKECTKIDKKTIHSFNDISLYPNSHYIVPINEFKESMDDIISEMKERVLFFRSHNKHIEAQRIEERVRYDMEMIKETGSCKGIENYSRYFSKRISGSRPDTLFDYFPKDSLLFVDESHISVPQIKAMYFGDRARKQKLIEYGFRLPSAFDNRPLKFEEWDELKPTTLFVSATPSQLEISKSDDRIVYQIIRPTGLLDPVYEIRPTADQMPDIFKLIQETVSKGLRIICLTVTKKYSERLSQYFQENGISSKYIHADIEVPERVNIIKAFRQGVVDVLIGINLLREGIDIPECGLVIILDADKEGFLRSKTSLIQMIGRGARNKDGKVILYADRVTQAMKDALEETDRRREIQQEYNKKHNITPMNLNKKILSTFDDIILNDHKNNISSCSNEGVEYDYLSSCKINELKKIMKKASDEMNFDLAIACREKIAKLNK